MDEETKAERKKRLAREATARWREKNREHHRAYQKQRTAKLERQPCPICDVMMGKPGAARCISCQKRENHPTWKGGRYLNVSGYVMVLGRDGEVGKNKNGYILEHRRAMQDFLGRPLLPSETVHHINGIRSDNRIENLELWASRQPPGQRVQDLVQWAKQILELYDAECKEKW